MFISLLLNHMLPNCARRNLWRWLFTAPSRRRLASRERPNVVGLPWKAWRKPWSGLSPSSKTWHTHHPEQWPKPHMWGTHVNRNCIVWCFRCTICLCNPSRNYINSAVKFCEKKGNEHLVKCLCCTRGVWIVTSNWHICVSHNSNCIYRLPYT